MFSNERAITNQLYKRLLLTCAFSVVLVGNRSWLWHTFGDGKWLQKRPEAQREENRWRQEKSRLLPGESQVESISPSPKVIPLANLGAKGHTERKKAKQNLFVFNLFVVTNK